jgi:pimeloyl-ACP methyl ester carboxylesterase
VKARLKILGRTPVSILAIIALFFGIFSTSCANDPNPVQYSATSEIADSAIIYAQSLSHLDYKEGWFNDGETELHFVEAGSGPLIILYHGFPSYWLSWRDQIEALATTHRVIAVDGLGANLSSKPNTLAPYRVEALAHQIDRFANALSPGEPFVLIGHDWGAALSFAYAQAYPDRLRGVIGMSAPPYNNLLALLATSPEQQAISGYMQRFRNITFEQIKTENMATLIAEQSYAGLAQKAALNEKELALFHSSIGQSDTIDGGMNWYRANIPPWDAIDVDLQWPGADVRLSIPALFIWGEADGIFLPSTIDAMMAAEPKLQIARLPGVGHWTSMEEPALANTAILNFLGQLEHLP